MNWLKNCAYNMMLAIEVTSEGAHQLRKVSNWYIVLHFLQQLIHD